MSIANVAGDDRPELEFDQADRMRKALRIAHLESSEMAEYLGVSRTSVSAWINGRSPANVATLRLWAMKTGVPFEWLCPRLESNQRPRD